jgi:hypothetical protein
MKKFNMSDLITLEAANLAVAVEKRNRNPKHAEVQLKALYSATMTAFKESTHVALHKSKKKVMFFDTQIDFGEMPVSLENGIKILKQTIDPNQNKVSNAAKTLAKQSTKARVAK